MTAITSEVDMLHDAAPLDQLGVCSFGFVAYIRTSSIQHTHIFFLPK